MNSAGVRGVLCADKQGLCLTGKNMITILLCKMFNCDGAGSSSCNYNHFLVAIQSKTVFHETMNCYIATKL